MQQNNGKYSNLILIHELTPKGFSSGSANGLLSKSDMAFYGYASIMCLYTAEVVAAVSMQEFSLPVTCT